MAKRSGNGNGNGVVKAEVGTLPVAKPETAAVRERRQTLSAFRAMARYELEDAIPLLGQIYRGTLELPGMTLPPAIPGGAAPPPLPADPIGLNTRMRAIELLVKIGVPQQVEVRAWDGDWDQFAPDELERIVSGEHPEDVIESRGRA